MYGLFEEPPEQQPAKTRTMSIEAKREFVKLALQMLWRYGTLVCAEKPLFEQGGNPMNSRHSDMSGIAAVGGDGSAIKESVRCEVIIGSPTIGQHGCPMFHLIRDEWHQCRQHLLYPKQY